MRSKNNQRILDNLNRKKRRSWTVWDYITFFAVFCVLAIIVLTSWTL